MESELLKFATIFLLAVVVFSIALFIGVWAIEKDDNSASEAE